MIVFSQRIAKRQLDIQQVTNPKRCFIIQQRTARTSVYTMILTYLLTYPVCAMDDTRGRATKDAT